MTSNFELMNYYGHKRIPFFFLISYDKNDIVVHKLDELQRENIFFAINQTPQEKLNKQIVFNYIPLQYDEFKKSFDLVQKHLENGDTYLLNLTFETPIEINLTLEDIYKFSNSLFRIYYKGLFVCFTPEKFVEIWGNKISTNPMKGTIDCKIPDAEKKLLNDTKELAEHYTIVDLLRNDLSIVAKQVRVEKFRYVDLISTNRGKLLQTSSLITGTLENNWQMRIGDILDKLTPAGSITGAPKQKTIEIIDKIEQHNRGFYTGIAGLFDGENLMSFVLIRFIEKRNGKYFFKSGGGITTLSNIIDEYKELNDKIYVPIF